MHLRWCGQWIKQRLFSWPCFLLRGSSHKYVSADNLLLYHLQLTSATSRNKNKCKKLEAWKTQICIWGLFSSFVTWLKYFLIFLPVLVLMMFILPSSFCACWFPVHTACSPRSPTLSSPLTFFSARPHLKGAVQRKHVVSKMFKFSWSQVGVRK